MLNSLMSHLQKLMDITCFAQFSKEKLLLTADSNVTWSLKCLKVRQLCFLTNFCKNSLEMNYLIARLFHYVCLPLQECRSEQAAVCYFHTPLILFNSLDDDSPRSQGWFWTQPFCRRAGCYCSLTWGFCFFALAAASASLFSCDFTGWDEECKTSQFRLVFYSS